MFLVVRDDDGYIFKTNDVGAIFYFHFLVLPADATHASWTTVVLSYLIRGTVVTTSFVL